VGDRLEVHAYRVRRNREKLLDNLTVEPNADLEKDYGITVHSDLERALATRPELVLVCNPSSLHAPIALAAAKAGAHIFIEKPVSNSLASLEELTSIVRARKLLCYVGYNFRFHPGLVRMKQLIDGKHFGSILSVRAEIGEYLPDWHKYEDYRQMYAAREDLGGGVIFSQIHEMDLIYWFFGLPRTISCRGGKLSNLEIDVEDTASSLMQYDGPHGRFPILLHQDFLQRPPVRVFKICGDAGMAQMDLARNHLEIYDERGDKQEESTFPDFKRNDMFFLQTKHVLDCIAGASSAEVDLDAGIHSLRLALAARKSLAEGIEVDLTGGD
jgi:predicted dehydrogenase